MHIGFRTIAFALGISASVAALAQASSQPSLAPPSAFPLRVDTASDPILQLRHRQASFEEFRAVIAAAVQNHPGTTEYEALEDEARAALSSAREARRPSADINITSYRVISREFSNDPNNIIERTRAEQRTDALLNVQQVLFDFGSSAARVASAGARLRAAGADFEGNAGRTALGAVAAWYDVFSFRALVTLTEAFIGSQRDLKLAVEDRVRQGVSAEGDLARIDSYIASAQTRLARFNRQLAGAEARFTELTGAPPPTGLERAPIQGIVEQTRDHAAFAATSSPDVRAAQALADSAQQDARATRSDRLPQITGGIDFGRYGVFETDRDYDIRGRVALRQRLFGGINGRAQQAEARARAADARATRVREEASRDASIAWSDVEALEQQLEALEAAYIAARQSRDVIAERFRAARGTLFDIVQAEEVYFESATSYVQALTELDAARYVLLARTGRLLEVLAIDPAQIAPRLDGATP